MLQTPSHVSRQTRSTCWLLVNCFLSASYCWIRYKAMLSHDEATTACFKNLLDFHFVLVLFTRRFCYIVLKQ